MKKEANVVLSIFVLLLFVVVAGAQSVATSRPDPKITLKPGAGNMAKLPPVVSPVLVPKLIFKSSESIVSKSGQKQTSIVLSIVNWSEFPAELFVPAPHLPPDPCGPGWDYPKEKHEQRMLLTVYSRDRKQIHACSPYPTSKSLGFIRFYIGEGKPLPPSLLVILKDRLKGTTYESNLVSTSAASTGPGK